MNSIKYTIAQAVVSGLNSIFPQSNVKIEEVLINTTPSDFTGDYTVVLFPFVKKLGVSPDQLGQQLGAHLTQHVEGIADFNMVKGFLNIKLTPLLWSNTLDQILPDVEFGFTPIRPENGAVVIEYPSPNTNKPLHLGHLRNIFLGYSLARILEANGKKVHQVCLYNDRGTNISKSMLMYQLAAHKKTPESSGIKPDHLVAEYYVQYNDALKAELAELKAQGLSDEEAKKASKFEQQVADLTIRWEQNDPEVRALWSQMNGWFYQGVAKTYEQLNLTFEQTYYESDIYNLGKETVQEGLEKGIFFQKEDGSVWIDLTDAGLDQKLVLRSNGTSVYITQDMALAYQKQNQFEFNQSIYVVGNEQDYHFKVLFEILRRLGLKGSEHLHHLSYGMVELPTGKMKTREGTVVDADEIMDELIQLATETAETQGKLAGVEAADKVKIHKAIGLGALRYFILKVDPKKRIVFNPAESIDFNGNTAPFIQFIYVRTQSLLRNAHSLNMSVPASLHALDYAPHMAEQRLIRTLTAFPEVVQEAATQQNPAVIANYTYQLASEFSTFYHDFKVLKEEQESARLFRLALSKLVGDVIRKGLYLLGIEAPDRM